MSSEASASVLGVEEPELQQQQEKQQYEEDVKNDFKRLAVNDKTALKEDLTFNVLPPAPDASGVAVKKERPDESDEAQKPDGPTPGVLAANPLEDDTELIIRKFSDLKADEKWIPADDYYVHIDILHGSSSLVKSRINSHMIRADAFDPRIANHFPTDLLAKGERDTLKRRRELAGIGPHRYEFWKVRKHFSLPAFKEMAEALPTGGIVRIVRIIDNDNDINIYSS